MAVTLSDIAEATGCSISSVSAALKGNRSTAKVSEKKRTLILEVASSLNYRPSHAARTLKLGKTSVLGLVVGEIHTPHYGEMVSLLMEEAAKYGYNIQTYVTNWRNDRHEEILNHLVDGRCDGIIYNESQNLPRILPYIKCLQNNDLPMVLLGPRPSVQPLKTAYVGEDWSTGFCEMVEYLNGKNIKKIIFAGDNVTYTERSKIDSLIKTCQQFNLELDLIECRNDQDQIYSWGRQYVPSPTLTTAILTENDTLAITLLKALHDAGIKVPEDVAVVGCNNTKLSQYTIPALSSLGCDKQYHAKVTIELVLKMIRDGKNSNDSIMIPTFFKQRDSA